jgi:hypothetical protein
MQHGMQHGMQHAGHTTAGVHGMVLLGHDPAYLYHLPMFMPPHNYQVLLAATPDDEVARGLRDLELEVGPDTFVTIVPRPFAITDLRPEDPDQPPLTEFTADVVRGHFERGGQTMWEGATFTVTELFSFEELPTSPDGVTRHPELEYQLFGDADRTLYLAHSLTGPPDFDQLLAVDVEGAGHLTATELERQMQPSLTVTGRADGVDQRLRVGETVAGVTSAGQHFVHDVQVTVRGELYFETGDLS